MSIYQLWIADKNPTQRRRLLREARSISDDNEVAHKIRAYKPSFIAFYFDGNGLTAVARNDEPCLDAVEINDLDIIREKINKAKTPIITDREILARQNPQEYFSDPDAWKSLARECAGGKSTLDSGIFYKRESKKLLYKCVKPTPVDSNADMFDADNRILSDSEYEYLARKSIRLLKAKQECTEKQNTPSPFYFEDNNFDHRLGRLNIRY